MRTLSRLAVASAILGGGLLIAGPVAAQEVDCDEYDTLAECPIGGGTGGPAQGGSQGGGSTNAGGTIGGATSSAATLPFTGGEVTLIALAGTAALGGGVALTVAGRKRASV